MNLSPLLSRHEFSGLREVAKGPLHGKLSKRVEATLIHAGLLKMVLGGLQITSDGHIRLMAGEGKCSD